MRLYRDELSNASAVFSSCYFSNISAFNSASTMNFLPFELTIQNCTFINCRREEGNGLYRLNKYNFILFYYL
jgi:hypothetical protein